LTDLTDTSYHPVDNRGTRCDRYQPDLCRARRVGQPDLILEKLDPERASDYSQSREIVEAGYESLYETINPAIKTTAVAAKATEEVPAILDMFQAVETSMKKLGKNADELSVAFEGFDSEHDEHHYGFAYFLRRKQGKWSELSHYPDRAERTMLPRYRHMVDAWLSIGKPLELTEGQIRELADKR
jgi:uncharacterized protein YfbU (UPF0304 family)